MDVLGIETTCDETAVAIVRDGREILAHFVASQTDLHSQYGGVFPELACRRHMDIIIPLIDKCLRKAGLEKTDLVAVARGPGLLGALLIGMHAAKALSLAWGVPLVGVNHVEAHLYAAMMDHEPKLPALGVVLSGGHTNLLEISEIGKYRQLGATVDDAIGEAFDKVASLLELPYPGGPEVEKLALTGDAHRFDLRAGKVKDNPLAFSFSGLKTNVLYTLKGQGARKGDAIQLDGQGRADLAASFQRACFEDVLNKVKKAQNQLGIDTIYLGGGVTANKVLRKYFDFENACSGGLIMGNEGRDSRSGCKADDDPDSKVESGEEDNAAGGDESRVKNFPELDRQSIYFPAPELSLDNAAMIAGLGYHVFERQGADPLDLEALPRIPF